jgi:hypothetical protein
MVVRPQIYGWAKRWHYLKVVVVSTNLVAMVSKMMVVDKVSRHWRMMISRRIRLCHQRLQLIRSMWKKRKGLVSRCNHVQKNMRFVVSKLIRQLR